MRQLTASVPKSHNLRLQNVPAEFAFVEQIAKRYAESQEQLAALYCVGVDAANTCKEKLSTKDYDRFAAWAVMQAIVQYKSGEERAASDNTSKYE